MTYKELIEQLSAELGLTQTEARELTRMTISELAGQLGKGKGFSIPELGTFRVRNRELKEMYSPWHEKKIVVPPKRVVTFSPSKKLKERVNQGETDHE